MNSVAAQTIGDYTLVSNPFWGGALFPTVCFAFAYFWPLIERRFTGDYAYHNVLDRPRDAPGRTAIGVAVFTWISLVFLAGASDRVQVLFDLDYIGQIWFYRVIVWVGPIVAGLIAHRVCVELQRGEQVERERKRAEAAARGTA